MRQHLSWTFTYQLPSSESMHGLAKGWSVDGVLSLAAGQPFNVNYLFEGDFNGGEFFGRPDLVGNPFTGTKLPIILNLAAFQVPCTINATLDGCTGNVHFGNLGRNAFVGRDFKNFGFSLAKDTKINERIGMQFRLNVYNLFNHPNFANPLWPNFGVDFAQKLDATGHGTGFLPVTATPDVGTGNPFLGGGGSRLELALKFKF